MTTTNEIEYQVGQHIVRARSYEEACDKLNDAYFKTPEGELVNAAYQAIEAMKNMRQGSFICAVHALRLALQRMNKL